jgi:hypothetical protein
MKMDGVPMNQSDEELPSQTPCRDESPSHHKPAADAPRPSWPWRGTKGQREALDTQTNRSEQGVKEHKQSGEESAIGASDRGEKREVDGGAGKMGGGGRGSREHQWESEQKRHSTG